MHSRILITDFPPLWASALLSDFKLLSSVVIGFLGTSATLLRNLSALAENRTQLHANLEQETARLGKLIELLGKIPEGDQFAECRQELKMQLAVSVGRLDTLRSKESSQNPQSNLTFWQQVFVWFPPAGQRALLIHTLAYIFILAGPLAILLWSLFEPVHSDRLSDAVIFVVFGGLAFRAWALAERKWAIRPAGLRTETGPLTAILVLRQPSSTSMLMAQIGMWSCIFCAVESLEDLFLSAVAGTGPWGAVLHFGFSLLGVGLCRTWAASEEEYSAVPTVFHFPRIMFPLEISGAASLWGMATAYIAMVVGPILAFVHWTALFNSVFDDPIDRIQFAFLWLASSSACNRLLSLRSRIAADRKMKGPGRSFAHAAS